MISPESVYLIHKEKEKELERRIEFERTAREQRAWIAGAKEQEPSRLVQAFQRIKGKFSTAALIHRPASRQTEIIAEPCPGAPC